MSALKISRQFLQQAITDELTTHSGNATVGLSDSTIPFSDTTTVTGATSGEIAYPGYARQTWPLTPINLNGNAYPVPQGTIIFNPPSAGPAKTVRSFFVLYTSPANAVAILGGDNLAGNPTITVGGLGLALILNLKDFDANNP